MFHFFKISHYYRIVNLVCILWLSIIYSIYYKKESIQYTHAQVSIWFWTDLFGTVNALLIYESVPVKCYLAIMVTGDRCLTAPAVDPWHSFTVSAVRRPSRSKQIAVSPSLGELFLGQPGLLQEPADRRHTYPHRCTLIAPALIFHCIHTRCNEAGAPSVPVWSLGSSILAHVKHREPVNVARPGNPSWSIFNLSLGIHPSILLMGRNWRGWVALVPVRCKPIMDSFQTGNPHPNLQNEKHLLTFAATCRRSPRCLTRVLNVWFCVFVSDEAILPYNKPSFPSPGGHSSSGTASSKGSTGPRKGEGTRGQHQRSNGEQTDSGYMGTNAQYSGELCKFGEIWPFVCLKKWFW